MQHTWNPDFHSALGGVSGDVERGVHNIHIARNELRRLEAFGLNAHPDDRSGIVFGLRNVEVGRYELAVVIGQNVNGVGGAVAEDRWLAVDALGDGGVPADLKRSVGHIVDQVIFCYLQTCR